MRNLNAEGYILAAEIAFSHLQHLLITIDEPQARNILSDIEPKSKGFLKIFRLFALSTCKFIDCAPFQNYKRKKLIFLLFAFVAAAAIRACAAAPALSSFYAADRRKSNGTNKQNRNNNIPDVHFHPPKPSRFPARLNMKAPTQAITHCQTATPAAHFTPSSRRIEATAETQGE